MSNEDIESLLRNLCYRNRNLSMEWTKEFWEGLLSIPKENRNVVNIECDNDQTAFNIKTPVTEATYYINSGIMEGAELLKVLGFNVEWV